MIKNKLLIIFILYQYIILNSLIYCNISPILEYCCVDNSSSINFDLCLYGILNYVTNNVHVLNYGNCCFTKNPDCKYIINYDMQLYIDIFHQ